jgi:hypothetical protein
MNISKGINRLSILAGIVGLVVFAYIPGPADSWQVGVTIMAVGFWVFWGAVRLIGWAIKGFMSKEAEKKDEGQKPPVISIK